ncbi:copper resistance protein NlpE [Acinetobacter rudis]|uniref:Copper resistance protein NlpE n=1 Tax=Acinetobacter rudis TaxID=632955 RepID=A0AAW8J5K2_9GAMM|nr:copper resistance protein NlpE [Acinetobacter rudis]MDQ8934663.1 copper resistance protein NlpE [Acinetobacter rudis]MDQ8951572.1 copper resistance protein NlpE [Acinetobacter rudis]MDQ9016767.1 copper resistance protein NlpE [Acinetobacter rudis]
MKKTLLVLSLSALALAACSKTKQNTADANSVSQTAEVTASQAATVETVASQAHDVNATSETPATSPVEGNAQLSLDWNGNYKGVLPCASCEGIETKLTLNNDKTYELSETYLGKGDGKPQVTKGKFSFNKAGDTVVLDAAADKRQYFVGENHIVALDQEGKKITGALAKNYELQKQNP